MNIPFDSDHADQDRVSSIDWVEARRFITRALRRSGIGRGELDDLVQEVSVRVMRAARKTEVVNLEALMNTIADRTTRDLFRRRRRWSALVTPLADATIETEPAEPVAVDPLSDPRERVRFVVLESFQADKPGCYELGLAYFESLDWNQVARGLGRSAEAIRKQWSRCVNYLRDRAKTDPGFESLTDWDG